MPVCNWTTESQLVSYNYIAAMNIQISLELYISFFTLRKLLNLASGGLGSAKINVTAKCVVNFYCFMTS